MEEVQERGNPKCGEGGSHIGSKRPLPQMAGPQGLGHRCASNQIIIDL